MPEVDKAGELNYKKDTKGKPKLVLSVIELDAKGGRIVNLSICNGRKLVYHWEAK